tara:strand:+ start:291 stop:2066 length:1776 start_codon:yes stop_codon:yes gene_type:complete
MREWPYFCSNKLKKYWLTRVYNLSMGYSNKNQFLFFDIGSNKGQSIELYYYLFKAQCKNTNLICIEASREPKVINPLNKIIEKYRNKFNSIMFLNAAASNTCNPLFFFDGIDEGSTLLKSKFNNSGKRGRIKRLSKNIIKFLLNIFISDLKKFPISRKRLVSAININNLIPTKSKNWIIDIKLDIEGAEYNLIDSLIDHFNHRIFRYILIEIHGYKAGFSFNQDRDILYKCRKLSTKVFTWDASFYKKKGLDQILLSDLIFQRLRHYQRFNFFKQSLKKSFYKLLNKLLGLPLIRSKKYLTKNDAFNYLKLSNSFKINHLNNYKNNHSFDNSPEIRLLKSKIQINLLKNKDTRTSFKELCKKVEELYFHDISLLHYNPDYLMKTADNNIPLLKTKRIEQIKEEEFGFLKNPLIHFPEIIDLLLSSEFEDLFSRDHSNIRIANVQIKPNLNNKTKLKKSSFKRDYSSYYTVKLFIPLLKQENPYLEYIPSTELTSTSCIHYSPQNIIEDLLPKDISNLPRKFTNSDPSNLSFVATNSINRELFHNENQITLIITYLSHPILNSNPPKAMRDDLLKRIKNEWAENHLSFIEPA